MAEQDLDDANVDAVLQEVRGEGMAQRMRPDALGDPSRPSSLHHDAMKLTRRDRSVPTLAGKQPALALEDALPVPLDPLISQEGKEIGG